MPVEVTPIVPMTPVPLPREEPRTGPVLTTPEAGGEIVRPQVEVPIVEAHGSRVDEARMAQMRADSQRAARRGSLDTMDHKLATFGEGVADMLTMGLVRSTGDEADLRREVNWGSAILGETVGFGLSMLTGAGPANVATRVGEAAGAAAAKALVRRTTGVLGRGIQEGVSAATFAGLQAANHQMMDAVLEDRPLSGEAILDQMKLAGVLGFGVGGVAGAMSKVAASRAKVKAQGGLLSEEGGEVVAAFRESLAAYDSAVARYSTEIGALKVLSAKLPEEVRPFITARVRAMRSVEKAGAELRKLDVDKALSAANPEDYARLQAAVEKYEDSIGALNDVMRAQPEERAFVAQRPTETAAPVPEPAPAPELAPEGTVPGTGKARAKLTDSSPGGLEDLNRVAGVKPEGAKLSMEAPPPLEMPPELEDFFRLDARPHPGEEASARVASAFNRIVESSGGRLDAASALGLLEKSGLRRSTSQMGKVLDQLWSLRRAGQHAADEARGVLTPLRDVFGEHVQDRVLKRLLKAGLGYTVGGPAGAVVGALVSNGKIASAAGTLMQKVAVASEKLLSSRGVRAAVVSSANRPWAYMGEPIQDPVERIQEIHHLAGNPDAIRARVRRNAGDLALSSPELIKALEDRTVQQLTALSIKAPAIFFDRLGRPLSPPSGTMRKFHEYENGMNDLDGLLKSVGSGAVTQPQVDALRDGWTSAHIRLSRFMLEDPERLRRLPLPTLKVIERVTGVPLTNSRDPGFLLRQTEAWMRAGDQGAAPDPNAPAGHSLRPQAFNINPSGNPTPAQANATGRAPGN